MRDDVLKFDLFECLCDLLCEGESFLLLAHLVVNQGHVLVRALFLGFLSHLEHFAVKVAHVLHEGGAVPDQGALDGVDQGAGLLVESVTAAGLNRGNGLLRPKTRSTPIGA